VEPSNAATAGKDFPASNSTQIFRCGQMANPLEWKTGKSNRARQAVAAHDGPFAGGAVSLQSSARNSKRTRSEGSISQIPIGRSTEWLSETVSIPQTIERSRSNIDREV